MTQSHYNYRVDAGDVRYQKGAATTNQPRIWTGWAVPSYCARLPPFCARPEAARTGGADATTARASLGIQRQAARAPRSSLSAPPTNARCSPATTRCGSTGFWPACAAKMAPSTATPSVAPIIRAVLTTPAAAPAWAFGAAETATESNGPVLKPKPTPIDKKANSINTISAVRESVERANSPSPISANPHVIIGRAPKRVASLPDFTETRKKARDTGSICNPTVAGDAPRTVCRNKGIKNSIAYMPNVMAAAATEAAENACERKIVSGSSGCSVRISTMAKQANVHTAATKKPIVAKLLDPQCGPSMKATDSVPSINTASIWPGASTLRPF